MASSDNVTMSHVNARIETFSSWTKQDVPILMLAYAGFYYTGKQSDEVTCFSCGVKLRDWEPHHLPLVRHNAAGSCQFVTHQLQSTITRTDPSDYQEEEKRPYSESWLKSVFPSNSLLLPTQSITRITLPKNQPLPKTGHVSSAEPTLPLPKTTDVLSAEAKTLKYYQDENNRYASFFKIDSPWPLRAPVSTKEMAEAGLFYTGTKDKVQCAYCRGKLYNWAQGDDAFTQHNRHFPKCPFVVRKLSQRQLTQESTPTPDPPRHELLESVTLYPSVTKNPSKEKGGSDKLEKLEHELSVLKNQRTCRICIDKEGDILFLPCRHMVTCEVCSRKLKKCPICRANIISSVKTFIS